MRAFALFVFLAFASASQAANYCPAQLPAGEPHSTATHTAEICHQGYAVLSDLDHLVPRYVAYTLTGDHTFGCLERGNQFHADENLTGRRSLPKDFDHSGHDQGHMAPAQDFAYSASLMRDSFSMANMSPQVPGLNRQGWERGEEYVRAWAWSRGAVTVYVGPILGGNETIGEDHVAVPVAFWKVVVDEAAHEAVGFVMPNQAEPKGALTIWAKPIADIEAETGVTLPLEGDKDVGPWPADLSGWHAEHAKRCPSTKN